MNSIHIFIIFHLLVVAGFNTQLIAAGELYFSEKKAIRRVSVDNQGNFGKIETLFTDRSVKADSITSIEVHTDQGKIYWVNHWTENSINSSELKWANLDGSNQEVIAFKQGGGVEMWGINSPIGDIALGLDVNKLFWGTRGMTGRIFCSDLDGTNVRTLMMADCGGLAFYNNTLYWMDWLGAGNQIIRADLDCLLLLPAECIGDCLYKQAPECIESQAISDSNNGFISGIALDETMNKVYTISSNVARDNSGQLIFDDSIIRYDSFIKEGINDLPEFVSSFKLDRVDRNRKINIDIDPDSGVLYWTHFYDNMIHSLDTNGNKNMNHLSGLNYPRAITFVKYPKQCDSAHVALSDISILTDSVRSADKMLDGDYRTYWRGGNRTNKKGWSIIIELAHGEIISDLNFIGHNHHNIESFDVSALTTSGDTIIIASNVTANGSKVTTIPFGNSEEVVKIHLEIKEISGRRPKISELWVTATRN